MITSVTIATLSSKLAPFIPFLWSIPTYLRELAVAKQAIDTLKSTQNTILETKKLALHEINKRYLTTCIVANVVSVALLITGIAAAILFKQPLMLAAPLLGVVGLQSFRICVGQIVDQITPLLQTD